MTHHDDAYTQVRTLLYDENCCHIQGICEWTACKDVVLSKLSDGAVKGAVGLYVGSGDRGPALVPPQYLANNGTLLVFTAYKVVSAEIQFGIASDDRVTLVPTSSTNLTATSSSSPSSPSSSFSSSAYTLANKSNAAVGGSNRRSLLLGGGFWMLEKQDVLMTTIHENSTHAAPTKTWIFGKAVSGQQQYRLVLDSTIEAGAVSFTFEKQKQN